MHEFWTRVQILSSLSQSQRRWLYSDVNKFKSSLLTDRMSDGDRRFGASLNESTTVGRPRKQVICMLVSRLFLYRT